MKHSKKSKGAEVLEANDMAPIETVSEPDEKFNADICVDKEPIEPLEPEEVGIRVYIFAPKHCKSFRKLAAMQFQNGIVDQPGAVRLSDGQVIRAGATCKTEMTPALKVMLRDGVFLAGKAPRKEGKGARKVV